MMTTPTDALVLVDKPAGVTSFDVVRAVGRCIGTRSAGHTGTLDPFATGLVIVLCGRGTRLIRYVPGDPKVYLATIRFGTETDTDDSTGSVVRMAAPPEAAHVTEAIPQLTGEIEQIPPAYSARKVQGVRAYALARRGEIPELAPTRVTVHRWDVVQRGTEQLVVRISCGPGTYIRALARDLGRLTGSAAHLSALRREQNGPWKVEEATPLAAVQEGACRPRPLIDALRDAMPMCGIGAADVLAVRHGRAMDAADPAPKAALIDDAGQLIAVVNRVGSLWQPECVLAHE